MEHVYAKCTAKTCGDCGGFGEYNGGPCGQCGGSGRTRCGGCRTEGADCMFECLGVCTICGGFEGSLLPHCPGEMLTMDEHDAHYAHYCAKTGPFSEDPVERRVFAERYVAEHDSPAARRFYDAVREAS